MRFCSIASGSDGNCHYVEGSSSALLIDAGLSGKHIRENMEAAGLAPDRPEAIFVTHEHSAHVAGIAVWAKKFRIPVYATEGSWKGMGPLAEKVPGELARVIRCDESVRLGGMTVTPIPLCHDANDPVGYLVEENGTSAAVVTDTGVMTEEMLRRGCHVTAVEKDPVLAERLAASLGNPPNLSVIAGDALDVIASPSTSSLFSSLTRMISNLPYQAGTRILLELVKARELPSMTVLVQTEVAERLAAKEGTKTRGLAGVWAQLDYDVRIVRKVSASCFWPRPEIGSSVVRLDRHDRNLGLSAEERDLFHRLTKQAFEHRRKQLGSVFKDMIQSTARAEELSNEDWIELVKGLIG
mgnify:CR=1 FL=1